MIFLNNIRNKLILALWILLCSFSFIQPQIMLPTTDRDPEPVKVEQKEPVTNVLKSISKKSVLIEISSFPTNAEIYLNNELIGNTPMKIPSFVGEPITLLIQKEFCKPWQKTLTPTENINFNISLPSIRESLIREHSIIIQSKPAPADVYINEKLIGKTPTGFFIKHGKKVQIRLAKNGYAGWERTLIAQNDSLFKVNLISIWELRQNEYPVFINTWPQNARITINNRFIGHTPIGFKTRGGDTLITVLERKKYKPFPKDIFIDGKKSVIVDFTTVSKKSPWPWIGGTVAAVVGGVIYYLKYGETEPEPTTTETWPTPPGRP